MSGFHIRKVKINKWMKQSQQCYELSNFSTFQASWLLPVQPVSTVKNSRFCPQIAFMGFVWISEQTFILALYNITWLISTFITETGRDYCTVRTGILNTRDYFSLTGLNYVCSRTTSNMLMWRTHVKFFPMKTQYFLPFVVVVVVVVVDVTVSNLKVFRVAMQQWVPFGTLSGYKIFHTAVNNNKYYILCVTLTCFSYLACKSHLFCAALSPYCHLWPVWLYHIFPH
jgi:predicted neutral ceramidase superfamily lipid hydrolase